MEARARSTAQAKLDELKDRVCNATSKSKQLDAYVTSYEPTTTMRRSISVNQDRIILWII